ncbi:MAG: hypothetical protein Q8P65_00540, partial [bacterium]|nr:hypothetical protein [bacterium]
KKKKKWAQELILLIFFLSYFAVVGKFAVGWMRYMLPLYPLLCLFGAVLIYKINQVLKNKIKSHFMLNTLYLILYTSILVWPLSFMHIYTMPHSRITASKWMVNNIPPNSLIGTESWDDTLPIYPNTFQFLELPMNERDVVPSKWQRINDVLSRADYIVISSNRNYASLQKLTNCSLLPQDRCFAKTARYYEDLFDQKLGFVKIAEFSSYPTMPILGIGINDQSADESFTVYDHPKVMIFKNETK